MKVRRKRLLGHLMTANGNEAAGGKKYDSKTLSPKFQKNGNYVNRNQFVTVGHWISHCLRAPKPSTVA